ncbi:hypothetical protein HJC23_003581 [Cyclotella cryptica]|uniref:glycerol kinase n=1 Tax=Cyclotella cryptica TaxID=29204 RepID=A0ABD3NUL1_9STRA|eukprot:CCRYP_019490-RB/>CCRYP_019490-RB protein AED:0.08 eAED:0.08 QI:154/1/1/1/0.5/0.33/3/157/610
MFECHVHINQSVLSALLSLSSPPSLVGSIDQGTSSSRFLLVTASGSLLSTAQVEFHQCYPTSSPHLSPHESCAGWHEHDPFDIWDSVCQCISRTVEELDKRGLHLCEEQYGSWIKAVGITNQRETTLAWNVRTGKVYYNAIVWDDTRTASVAETIIRQNADLTCGVEAKMNDVLRAETGLPVASYFAGTKVRWLIDHISELQADLTSTTERENVRFGTVDVWLLYMLTGFKRSISESEDGVRLGYDGGVFKTDVSNASRWLFMNLERLEWDAGLVNKVVGGSACWNHCDNEDARSFPVATALPKIVPSSDCTIGTVHGIPCPTTDGSYRLALKNVPITAILGDQQAALFGQTCFLPGEAKCTYGTGLFLMMNTGTDMIPSTHGLLTTVAYQLGQRVASEDHDPSRPIYALEGSVAFSGSTIQWLRDRLEIISSPSETESLAMSVPSSQGMYLVPAFSGLFAPHWRPDARGCLVGLTATHSKAHIVRSALESSAYQAREVFDSMVRDSNVELKEMRVDGGATANKFLMQFQSDILNVPVVRPEHLETTGWGAALAAGLAVGVWNDLDGVRKMWAVNTRWNPNMDDEEREKSWKGWNKAVQRSLNWMEDDEF